MAANRRRRLPNRPERSAAIADHTVDTLPIAETSRAFLLIRRWLIPICMGILLGASVCIVAGRILVAPRDDQDSLGDGLLMAQQLDALFGVVESQLRENGSSLASCQELLDTFLLYDRRYVEEASLDPSASVAKAYAARRMGHCCQILGKLESSCEHYRRSRDLFESCLREDPEVVELFSLWVNAHTQIVYVELSREEMRSATNEYRTALRALRQSALVQDVDYHKALMLEFKSLTQLGIELKLYAEAMQFAERFALSARVLKDRSPHDAELVQDVNDAQLYLRILTSLLNQQGNS